MNYIWELIVRAKNENIDLKEISFKLANRYSPYMELSNQDINSKQVEAEAEINPYYRFFDIFKELFMPDYDDYQELRGVFLDIVVHFLTTIDLKQGMYKQEYYKKIIYHEIKGGYFGQVVEEGIDYFTNQEKSLLLDNIYRFYNTGNHIYHLKDTIKKLFKDSIIYVNCYEINEVLIYIGQVKNQTNLMKLKVIKELFLPVNFKITTYWEKHFGIIGVVETMTIGEISIYEKEEAKN